jgi:hypothetical protein
MEPEGSLPCSQEPSTGITGKHWRKNILMQKNIKQTNEDEER